MIIEAIDLKKSFGQLTAVKGINFQVAPGEIFAFLGPNGAGKSTVIRMLTTLCRPTSGQIRVDGIDPVKSPGEVRRRFGIVFQDPSLDLELTGYENLDLHGALYRVPRAVRKARIRELLEHFELWEQRNDFAKIYSGGMKRRLEIARCFLHTPKIIFLDEPTLGLDPQTRNRLWDQVGRLNREAGVTVFLTTHYLDEAERVAHRLAIIDHGRIVASGSPFEIKQQTATDTLESAFLRLTGSTIREETASPSDRLRSFARSIGR